MVEKKILVVPQKGAYDEINSERENLFGYIFSVIWFDLKIFCRI
nr:hypothetical protein [Mycoplasmopsis bovis]